MVVNKQLLSALCRLSAGMAEDYLPRVRRRAPSFIGRPFPCGTTRDAAKKASMSASWYRIFPLSFKYGGPVCRPRHFRSVDALQKSRAAASASDKIPAFAGGSVAAVFAFMSRSPFVIKLCASFEKFPHCAAPDCADVGADPPNFGIVAAFEPFQRGNEFFDGCWTLSL